MAARASAEVLGQFASPYQLSSRLAAGPLSSKCHVLGRQQRSTYIQVRLALLAPSGVVVRAEGRSPEARAGLIWLATWPRTQSGGGVNPHGLHDEGGRGVQV